jgi:hypothetical protein
MKVCFVFNVLVLVFDEDVGFYGGVGATRKDDVIADVIGWLRVKVFMHVLQKEMGLYSSCSVLLEISRLHS